MDAAVRTGSVMSDAARAAPSQGPAHFRCDSRRSSLSSYRRLALLRWLASQLTASRLTAALRATVCTCSSTHVPSSPAENSSRQSNKFLRPLTGLAHGSCRWDDASVAEPTQRSSQPQATAKAEALDPSASEPETTRPLATVRVTLPLTRHSAHNPWAPQRLAAASQKASFPSRGHPCLVTCTLTAAGSLCRHPQLASAFPVSRRAPLCDAFRRSTRRMPVVLYAQ